MRAPPSPPVAQAASDPYDDDDDMPKDIDAFRLELARRIDAFVESRQPQYEYEG